MDKIVIEIRGGVLVEVYSDRPNLEITLVDWDNIESNDTPVNSFPYSPLECMEPETAELIR